MSRPQTDYISTLSSLRGRREREEPRTTPHDPALQIQSLYRIKAAAVTLGKEASRRVVLSYELHLE